MTSKDATSKDPKDLFDETCLAVLSRINSFEEVDSVDFKAGESTQQHEFSTWEKRNSPFKIPDDMKGFYSLFNGVSVKLTVPVGSKSALIGEMQLNKLDAITRVSLDGAKFIPNEVMPQIHLDAKNCTAYSLSCSPDEYGTVVLLYRLQSEHTSANSGYDNTLSSLGPAGNRVDPLENPEVWFVDNDSNWHFLTYTFTQFLRIMVVHLGIIGWQMAFTPQGIPLTTQQWMGLFCKERLCVDIHWAKQESKKS